MTAALRCLRAMLAYRSLFRARREDPAWEQTDRETLRAFLTSDTGRKLRARLTAAETILLTAAAEAPAGESVHACGRASGWRACAAWLHSLSAPEEPRSSDPTARPEEGEPDPREHYRP